MQPAIILLAHGSPDPDWVRPLVEARDRLRSLDPGRRVELAYLDHVAPSLADVVADLQRSGIEAALVIAAFLSAGGNHLKKHVPALLAETARAHPQMRLQLVPGALGATPEVVEALARAAHRLADATTSGS